MGSASRAPPSSTALAETSSQHSRSSASTLQGSMSQDLLASLVTRERCMCTTDLSTTWNIGVWA